MDRKPYPSDISTEEWNFVAPYLTLICEEALGPLWDVPFIRSTSQETYFHQRHSLQKLPLR
jgi:hypothetical protein